MNVSCTVLHDGRVTSVFGSWDTGNHHGLGKIPRAPKVEAISLSAASQKKNHNVVKKNSFWD
jgi:hypothetical protein